MMSFETKLMYIFSVILFISLGVFGGYFFSVKHNKVDNLNIVKYATDYSLEFPEEEAVAASTQAIDIDVIYEDYYSVCDETIKTTKRKFGTNLDTVEEEEKKLQEKNGLDYRIKEELSDKVIYTRTINENCPNHFLVILEDNKVNVYTIKGENKKVLYMNLENVNVENLRTELFKKIESGVYINSRENLNKFIEDLET